MMQNVIFSNGKLQPIRNQNLHQFLRQQSKKFFILHLFAMRQFIKQYVEIKKKTGAIMPPAFLSRLAYVKGFYFANVPRLL